jgi:DNA-binding XRE family transcriptional regulator
MWHGGDENSMANKIKKIPYARIKGLRAERQMSMASMAKIVGISEGSYLARENGTKEWKSSEMIIMSRYFKHSLDELFI